MPYSDGLEEGRRRLSEGLTHLKDVCSAATLPTSETLCDRALTVLPPGGGPDDTTLLALHSTSRGARASSRHPRRTRPP